jgi:hypothetical protein
MHAITGLVERKNGVVFGLKKPLNKFFVARKDEFQESPTCFALQTRVRGLDQGLG